MLRTCTAFIWVNYNRLIFLLSPGFKPYLAYLLMAACVFFFQFASCRKKLNKPNDIVWTQKCERKRHPRLFVDYNSLDHIKLIKLTQIHAITFWKRRESSKKELLCRIIAIATKPHIHSKWWHFLSARYVRFLFDIRGKKCIIAWLGPSYKKKVSFLSPCSCTIIMRATLFFLIQRDGGGNANNSHILSISKPIALKWSIKIIKIWDRDNFLCWDLESRSDG